MSFEAASADPHAPFTRWLQPLRISLRGRQGFCGKAERMTKQLLHLVMGGRVKDPQGVEFQDLNDIHVVGIYPNYAAAEEAWRGHAQRTVDDAEMKYVIVHLHRLLEPELKAEYATLPRCGPALRAPQPAQMNSIFSIW